MRNQINVQHIKNYFNNKSVLILGILSAIPIILSLFVAIPIFDSFLSFAQDLSIQGNLNLDSSDAVTVNDISIRFFKTYYILIYVIEVVVSLLPAAAWLYIYFTSKSNNINKTPNAGFMYFFVMGIINIVSSVFALIISFIYGILGIVFLCADNVHGEINGEVFYGHNDESVLFGTIFLVLGLLLFILLALSLGYEISKVKFFNAAKKSMTSPNMKVSGKGYGVFSVINAILVILSGIATIIGGIFLMFFADTSLFDDLDVETIITTRFLAKLALPVIIAGVLSLLSSIPIILEAKVAFGYCKMAKTIPPTPMEQIYNSPYHQNIPPYSQRYYNTNQQYNGGVQNSSPIPPYGQPVPQQNQQTQPEPVQQNDNTNPYEGNPYENN